MFVIIFESIQKTKIKVAPLLLPITKELLQKQVSYLQQLALQHFKDHLSPFIRKQHLQLHSSQKMKPDYPIFIYCNFKQQIHKIQCTLKPYDQPAQLKRSYLLKYSIVLVNSKDYSQKIIKQNSIVQLDSLMPKDGSAYILGKQIQLLPKNYISDETEYVKKWSELILEKWSKFQSPNSGVYIMI